MLVLDSFVTSSDSGLRRFRGKMGVEGASAYPLDHSILVNEFEDAVVVAVEVGPCSHILADRKNLWVDGLPSWWGRGPRGSRGPPRGTDHEGLAKRGHCFEEVVDGAAAVVGALVDNHCKGAFVY